MLGRSAAGRHEDALLLVSADHGMTAVDPATAIYIDAAFPECKRFMRRNKKGTIIAPGGSPRDMFLYIEDGQVDAARAFLAARLEGRAEVRRVDEMLAAGYFGPAPVAEAHVIDITDVATPAVGRVGAGSGVASGGRGLGERAVGSVVLLASPAARSHRRRSGSVFAQRKRTRSNLRPSPAEG